jgi:hypothetical protein
MYPPSLSQCLPADVLAIKCEYEQGLGDDSLITRSPSSKRCPSRMHPGSPLFPSTRRPRLRYLLNPNLTLMSLMEVRATYIRRMTATLATLRIPLHREQRVPPKEGGV